VRDRTLILLGLTFLVLAIGIGVDRSLEAGSKMVGTPMAPGIREIYNKQAPAAREKVETLASNGKRQVPLLFQVYSSQVMLYAEEARSKIGAGTNEFISSAREIFTDWSRKTLEEIRERLQTVSRKVAMDKTDR